MKDNSEIKNNIFTSIWIVFFVLLTSYSVFILIKAPDLELNLKPHTDEIIPYAAFRMILGLYFFIAVFNIKKIKSSNVWLWAIISVGLLSRVILIPSAPVLEDDYNRYLWDGAVTASSYNPYIYSPLDAMNADGENVPEELHRLAEDSGEIINNINHPHIRTIYPILSQITFAAAYFISPWEYWAWKLLLLLFDLLLLFFLIKILNHFNLPKIFISFYWLNPIVIHEFFNSAHMDLLAMLFVTVALYLYLMGKTWHSLICLALGVGFKLWPIVLFPLLLRTTWPNRKLIIQQTTVFAGIVLVLFVPVLISNLDESLGFVIYAGKWVNNAAFYTIYQWLVQQIISLSQINVSCLSCINRWSIFIIYLVICILILRRRPGNDLQFFNTAFLIVAVLYLISPTQFPWYYTWMVPLLAIRPKVSLFLYPLLLPLYQLQYLGDFIVYTEHIPILILFILEMKGVIWKERINFISIGKGIEINTP